MSSGQEALQQHQRHDDDQYRHQNHDDAIAYIKTGYWCMAPIKPLLDAARRIASRCSTDHDHLATEADQDAGSWWGSLDFQQRVYDEVLQDAVALRYPPSVSFRQRFTRALVNDIEAANQELHEGLLEQMLDLAAISSATTVSSSTTGGGSGAFCYRNYQLCVPDRHPLTLTVRLLQEFNQVGMAAWEAGFFMAEHALANQDLFAGSSCIELGAGIGVTAATLWQLKPRVLIATDYAPSVLDNLAFNLQLSTTHTYNTNIDDLDSTRLLARRSSASALSARTYRCQHQAAVRRRHHDRRRHYGASRRD